MAQSVQPLASLLQALEQRVAALEAKVGGSTAPIAAGTSTTGSGTTPAATHSSATMASGGGSEARVQEFDAIVSEFGDGLVAAAAKVGPAVAPVGTVYKELYLFVRKMINIAVTCKQPSADALKRAQADLMQIAAPLRSLKGSKDFPSNDLATAAENGVTGFTWVIVDSGALDVLQAGLEAAQFYTNKVRTASTSTAELKAIVNLMDKGFQAMLLYAKKHFRGGLKYNDQGGDPAALLAAPTAGAPAAPAPAAAAPAPAPAAAAAAKPAATSPAAAPASGAGAAPANTSAAASRPDPAQLQSALFAQVSSIDQSSGRTAGLRHVTKDMKASANRDAPAVAPKSTTAAAAAPTAATGGAAARDAMPTGTPLNKLVDQRWKVEFQTNLTEPLHIDEGLTIKHEVYIFGCQNAIIYIDRKCKGIRIDTCRNVTIVLDSTLSGVEVVNSRKMKIQVQKSLPSVAIDKTDGIMVGLSWASRSAQIVTSKSSEMNITFPVSEAPDADWIEQPIPEQFVSCIGTDNKVSTTVSDLYTH